MLYTTHEIRNLVYIVTIIDINNRQIEFKKSELENAVVYEDDPT